MSLWPLLVIATLFGAPLQQGREAREVEKVNALCGTLVRVKHSWSKDHLTVIHLNSKPLKKVKLQLHARTGTQPCCDGAPLLEETITTGSGEFKFRQSSGTEYWLIAIYGGRRYFALLLYEPVNQSELRCADHVFSIDKSNPSFHVGIGLTAE
ncbi:MAG: hypothetical protein ACRD5M_12725 [Candidatus Acidiferrales bacterium]